MSRPRTGREPDGCGVRFAALDAAGARSRRHADHGRSLYKSFFSILRRNPLIVFSCAAWLFGGRAALKRQLALRSRIDWDRVRFHQDVVALAIREKTLGRAVVLATAADAVLAEQLASQLPCIEQVFASDGEQNLKGAAKAELLGRLYPDGFIYAGDSKSDLAVWARARGLKNPKCLSGEKLNPLNHL